MTKTLGPGGHRTLKRNRWPQSGLCHTLATTQTPTTTPICPITSVINSFDDSGGIITLMAKKKTKKRVRTRKIAAPVEKDSVFFMKLVFYFLLGAMWVRLIGVGSGEATISIPLGFVVGLFFARHEHFTIDRKIEYVVLFLAMVLSFYLPVGILL